MVHSVSGWTRGVQVKLWDLLRTRAIPERLSAVFTTRRYTVQIHVYLTLPYNNLGSQVATRTRVWVTENGISGVIDCQAGCMSVAVLWGNCALTSIMSLSLTIFNKVLRPSTVLKSSLCVFWRPANTVEVLKAKHKKLDGFRWWTVNRNVPSP